MHTEINVLTQQDLPNLKDLLAVFAAEFEMKDFAPPADEHLQALLAKDSFYAITGKVEGKVIGGLTAYVLDQYYTTKPLAYIYDLAVLKSYQRKGIGKKLVSFTTDFFRQKGFAEVFVQADRVDGYALNFYRLTQPTNEEDVIHFSYSL